MTAGPYWSRMVTAIEDNERKGIVMTRGYLIRTRLAALLWAFMSVLTVEVVAGSASAATFTVTSAADTSDLLPGDGKCGGSIGRGGIGGILYIQVCTLRAAIEEVNAQPVGTGPHTINFNISGDLTISLTKALPDIKQPVVIDAGTQPIYVVDKYQPLSPTLTTCSAVKFNRRPCVQLNANGWSPVLTLAAGNSTVRFLAIYNYSGTGVLVTSDNNVVEFSDIGTDASGVPGPAQQLGVAVSPPVGYSASNNVIRNSLISGNRQNGVLLSGITVRNNRVASNFIGTTIDGRAALLAFDFTTCMNNAQLALGVFIKNGSNNVIEANLISGNCSGVVIDATGQNDPYDYSNTTALRTYNQVLGNRIGIDATGTSLVPNRQYGVRITNASSNAVASTASGTGNVIVGSFYAVDIETKNQHMAARDNQVLNNYVGANAAGAPLGNGHTGVLLVGFLTGTLISGNVVANNPVDGIKLNSVSLSADSGSQNNFVQNNTASNNGHDGIWLDSGATGNTLQGNTALGNQIADLVDDNPSVSGVCPNTWIGNTFGTVGGVGASCIQ